MQKVEGSNPFSRFEHCTLEPKIRGGFVSLLDLALGLGSSRPSS
jgi:hypothetical protein